MCVQYCCVKFLGHIIHVYTESEQTLRSHWQRPMNVTELRHFMCMLNQLGKMLSNLTPLSEPLRDLMSSKSIIWIWGPGRIFPSFQKLNLLYFPEFEQSSRPLMCFHMGCVQPCCRYMVATETNCICISVFNRKIYHRIPNHRNPGTIYQIWPA